MRSPDLTLFLPSLAAGGAPRIMINVGMYLDVQGYNVEFVLARKEGEFLDDVEQMSVVGLNSRVIGAVLPLRKYLREKKPTVLMSTTHAANLAAIWATSLARVQTKLVVREPTTLSNQAKEFTTSKDKLIPPLVKYSYPHADQFIAISKGVKDELTDTVGIDQSKIEVIYNPIITPDIEPKSKEPVEHPWFDEAEPVVLSAGRLTPQKDFRTLIKAFDKLREKLNAKLVILGEGEQRQTLEKLIEEVGQADCIDLHGYVDNPYKYMRKADLFVLSSAWEGFGNVIVEAMACGTPVVSTDCESGPAEILADGEYGCLVPVGNHKQLSKSMVDMLNKEHDVVKIQQRAHEFTPDKVIPQYEEVLFS